MAKSQPRMYTFRAGRLFKMAARKAAKPAPFFSSLAVFGKEVRSAVKVPAEHEDRFLCPFQGLGKSREIGFPVDETGHPARPRLPPAVPSFGDYRRPGHSALSHIPYIYVPLLLMTSVPHLLLRNGRNRFSCAVTCGGR